MYKIRNIIKILEGGFEGKLFSWWSAEDEFRRLTAWGKKLLYSLVVWQLVSIQQGASQCPLGSLVTPHLIRITDGRRAAMMFWVVLIIFCRAFHGFIANFLCHDNSVKSLFSDTVSLCCSRKQNNNCISTITESGQTHHSAAVCL